MEDNKLARFGVSMDENLLKQFDSIIAEKNYVNRSEAIRDLVRDSIVQHSWENDSQIVAGSILLFYNHHHNGLLTEMMNIQHEYHHNVLVTTHLHLNHDSCLEIIVVKGKGSTLRDFSNKLISLKGVQFGKLTVSPFE